jgi:hypothetical protein
MTDVIIFTEDPGAANYILDLPENLSAIGISCIILADGPSKEYLKQRNINYLDASTLSATSIIETYTPKLVLVGTSENKKSLGLELIIKAKKNDIITASFIDMIVNTSERFKGTSNDPLKYCPDWLLVPDSITKNEYIKIGFNSNRVRVCGHPCYDRALKFSREWNNNEGNLKNELFINTTHNQKIIVFISESKDELNPAASNYNNNYIFRGRGKSKFRTHIILEEILDAIKQISPKPYLIVRLHPKNIIKEFSNYFTEVDMFHENSNPLSLLMKSDLVIGMSSMLLMEAALIGKPTLSLLPIESEANWLPNTKNGHTEVITDKSLIKNRIEYFLHNQDSKGNNLEFGNLFAPNSIEKVKYIIKRIINEDI